MEIDDIEPALEDLAGDFVFERGADYLPWVSGLTLDGLFATASVDGTRKYAVSLDLSGDDPGGFCTCPHFADGNFCKHLVAVGLVAADMLEAEHDDAAASCSAPPAAPAGHALEPTLEELVRSLDEDEARDLLVRAAEADPGLARQVRSRFTSPDDLGRELMSDARPVLRNHHYLGYWEAMHFGESAEGFLAELEQHLDAGRADTVVPVLRYATERLRKIQLSVDDSGGAIGGAGQYAMDLYARACAEAAPDPAELGEWFAQFRLASPGWPETSLAAFEPALGEAGVAAYRARIAALIEEDGDEDRSDFEVREVRLELAEYDGDTDGVVRILAEDGRSPRFGTIIERLRGAGRDDDEVLGWVDRAVAAGRVALTGNAYWLGAEFVADAYMTAGRDDEALDVVRARFTAQPGTRTLQVLEATAERLGAREAESAWAIKLLRTEAGADRRHLNALMEITLAQGDVELAWAAAQAHGAGGFWRELAEAVAPARPLDAAGLYREQVDSIIVTTHTSVYPEAAEYLVRMKALHAAAGTSDDFDAYLAATMEKYKNRPRMRKDFAARGLV